MHLPTSDTTSHTLHLPKHKNVPENIALLPSLMEAEAIGVGHGAVRRPSAIHGRGGHPLSRPGNRRLLEVAFILAVTARSRSG